MSQESNTEAAETVKREGDQAVDPAAPCSRSLRARLRDVIQKFRDEEEYLLLDKSSRALGGAIAYGDMATALSKLIEKPDKVEEGLRLAASILEKLPTPTLDLACRRAAIKHNGDKPMEFIRDILANAKATASATETPPKETTL